MNRRSKPEGFTLIELAVVCVVIGILAAIALPNYARTKARAGKASCVSNQRNLYLAAMTYAGDRGIQDVVLSSQTLFEQHAAAGSLTDCPDDLNDGHDDYEITIESGEVTDVSCLIMPDEHVWRH